MFTTNVAFVLSSVRVYVGITAAIAAFWLAPGSVADPSSFVIQGDCKIGGYAVTKDGTLFGAIRK